jgi:hypothetical protein
MLPFAGLVNAGIVGAGGRIVIVLAALHTPQLPAASFALTCQEYKVFPPISGVDCVPILGDFIADLVDKIRKEQGRGKLRPENKQTIAE